MLNKKGMSPLIVTILLIAFAVALGTMIMNWSSDNVIATPVSCESTNLVFQQAFDEDVLCFNEETGKLHVAIKNDGSSAMDFIVYRRINQDYTIRDVKMTDSYLGSGKIYAADIQFVNAEKVHIEFIPGIMIGGQESLCTEKALVRENIRIC